MIKFTHCELFLSLLCTDTDENIQITDYLALVETAFLYQQESAIDFLLMIV